MDDEFRESRPNRVSLQDKMALKQLKELESAHVQERTKLEAC